MVDVRRAILTSVQTDNQTSGSGKINPNLKSHVVAAEQGGGGQIPPHFGRSVTSHIYIPENITSLLPSVLLRVRSTSNNANGNKLVIFSGIASYYGDTYIILNMHMYTVSPYYQETNG